MWLWDLEFHTSLPEDIIVLLLVYFISYLLSVLSRLVYFCRACARKLAQSQTVKLHANTLSRKTSIQLKHIFFHIVSISPYFSKSCFCFRLCFRTRTIPMLKCILYCYCYPCELWVMTTLARLVLAGAEYYWQFSSTMSLASSCSYSMFVLKWQVAMKDKLSLAPTTDSYRAAERLSERRKSV